MKTKTISRNHWGKTVDKSAIKHELDLLEKARKRFKFHKFTYRYRNGRFYVTIFPNKTQVPDYFYSCSILRHAFPGIKVTSGSAHSVTGVMPTLFELIEQASKKDWVSMLRDAVDAHRPAKGINYSIIQKALTKQ